MKLKVLNLENMIHELGNKTKDILRMPTFSFATYEIIAKYELCSKAGVILYMGIGNKIREANRNTCIKVLNKYSEEKDINKYLTKNLALLRRKIKFNRGGIVNKILLNSKIVMLNIPLTFLCDDNDKKIIFTSIEYNSKANIIRVKDIQVNKFNSKNNSVGEIIDDDCIIKYLKVIKDTYLSNNGLLRWQNKVI